MTGAISLKHWVLLLAAALMPGSSFLFLHIAVETMPPTGAVAAITMVAVFSTAIPMILFFVLVRRIGVTNVSLVPLFMPVAAVGLGAAALGELLPWQAFAGLALILVGALAVSRKPPAPAAAAA